MANDPPARLMSLDAYRGFVMLAMASSGFALSRVAGKPEVLSQLEGTQWAEWTSAWQMLWHTLGYQFSHVAWTGCSFWDLIQPSFMFMVGVSLPFSVASREAKGHSAANGFLHTIYRSLALIALGVFLGWGIDVRFSFVNVLTQIGLGYTFLYLLAGRSLNTLALCATLILAGYGAWFALEPIDQADLELTKQYITEAEVGPDLDEAEYSQFQNWAAHWNKHTNAAAQLDRKHIMNRFPRHEERWNGRGFWINRGGYQTLNFIPSLATMIFGLMAGTVLSSARDDGARLKWLLKAGLICFIVSMAADSTIWPTQWLSPELQARFYEYSWSICPAVKRIWSPTWAVFSSGWAFWLLAGFYWLVDMRGCRWLVFPLAVVGLNSIAMYCMSQLIKDWIGDKLYQVTLAIEGTAGLDTGVISGWLDDGTFPYAPILDYSLRLFVMWCVCYWLYRKRLFIRI